MVLIDIIDSLIKLPYVGDIVVGSLKIRVEINKETLDDYVISTISKTIGQRHYTIYASRKNEKLVLQFDRNEYGK